MVLFVVENVEIARYTSGVSHESTTLTVNDQTSVVFSLRACTEVCIYLSQITGLVEKSTYKICLGSGVYADQVGIYSDEILQAHGHVSCVLDCATYKQYWVGWENGLIRVGYGSGVGANVYLEWQAAGRSIHPVSAVSVTSGLNDYIYWLFTPVPGEGNVI